MYAAAGIPAYWIVDPTAAEMTALRLDGTGIYQPYAEGPNVSIDWPVSVDLDIASLVQPPS